MARRGRVTPRFAYSATARRTFSVRLSRGLDVSSASAASARRTPSSESSTSAALDNLPTRARTLLSQNGATRTNGMRASAVRSMASACAPLRPGRLRLATTRSHGRSSASLRSSSHPLSHSSTSCTSRCNAAEYQRRMAGLSSAMRARSGFIGRPLGCFFSRERRSRRARWLDWLGPECRQRAERSSATQPHRLPLLKSCRTVAEMAFAVVGSDDANLHVVSFVLARPGAVSRWRPFARQGASWQRAFPPSRGRSHIRERLE